MAKTTVSSDQVEHIAGLATIPVTPEQAQDLAHAFEETLVVVDQLKQVDVSQVLPTSQVTGFINVWRPDTATLDYTLTQTEALQNAAKTYQGYFMVPGVLTAKDT